VARAGVVRQHERGACDDRLEPFERGVWIEQRDVTTGDGLGHAAGNGDLTREIGVRLALGARPATVLAEILRGALALATTGLALGLVAATVLTRFMQAMLYETSTTDPPSFIAVSVVMLLVAVAATVIPAKRAAGIDPLTALRSE
jgi:hypothetical protein